MLYVNYISIKQGTNYYQKGSTIPKPFHTVHGVLKARILKWLAIPFSSGPRFVSPLHHDPLSQVALPSMAHSFIESDKAVVHVIRLVSFP